MNFKIGQKVAAIESLDSGFSDVFIEKGKIYTISDFVLRYDSSEEKLLLLEGQPVIPHPAFGKYGWNRRCFRPLIETRIDIFHAILANPHKELETA